MSEASHRFGQQPRTGSPSRPTGSWSGGASARHHLAMVSAGLLILLYIVVLFPDFFSTQNPERTDARQAFIPVQTLHFFDDGSSAPWVPAIVGKRNPVTLRMEWTTDPQKQGAACASSRAASRYRVFGLFPTNIHLIGAGRSGASASSCSAPIGWDATSGRASCTARRPR